MKVNYTPMAEHLVRHPPNIIFAEKPLKTRVTDKVRDLVITILRGAGWANRVRLQKIAFITELEYIENTGRRLTPLRFWSWNFGPYSAELQDSVLGMTDCIEVTEHPNPLHPDTRESRIVLKKCNPVGGLSDRDLEFVELQAGSLRFIKTEKLIQMSKSHDMFKQTAFREEIKLDDYAERVRRTFEKIDKSKKIASMMDRIKTEEKVRPGKIYPNCRAFLKSI